MPRVVITSEQFGWRKILEALSNRPGVTSPSRYAEMDDTYTCMKKVLITLNNSAAL